MSDENPKIYNAKNQGKYKKEKTYPNLTNLKDYFLKIALTGDNKILFRCYDINSLDCTCYQVIKSAEEIFNLYEDMKIYEIPSVLFNIITKRFSQGYLINYNKKTDTIIIETKNNYNYDIKLNFELHKESITCLKEYILLLCQTIKKLKEDTSYLKEKKNDLELINIKKIPSLEEDIENLKSQIKIINKNLKDKEKEIDALKEEKKSHNKLIAKNTTEINLLKEENKNLKVGISDNQEDIEKINQKLIKNYLENQKMNVSIFNRKYRTHIGYLQIKNINLEGSYLGNIALNDLCKIEFSHLERLILSNNYLSDITPLENSKFYQLKELILFFNNIKDINILEKVNFHQLTKLGLSDNHISDINILKKVDFEFLEKLALSNNYIKDINILGEVKFRFLRELKLSKNKISDISIFDKVNFPKLKNLTLSNNSILDINVLSEAYFPILLELKLSNNKIGDIEPLSKAKFKKTLKSLYLSHNYIRDIKPLICKNCFEEYYSKRNSYRYNIRSNIISSSESSSSTCVAHFCYTDNLNELNIAGNNIRHNHFLDLIDYLREKIKVVVI